MKKIVSFILAIILLLGVCSVAGGVVIQKVASAESTFREVQIAENNNESIMQISSDNGHKIGSAGVKKFTSQVSIDEDAIDNDYKVSADENKRADNLYDAGANNREENLITKTSKGIKKRVLSDENKAEAMELCVIGNASKSVSPDSAKVTAVIETLDSDMVKSKDTNFEIFEKVLQALKDKGLAEEDFVLDSYTSYPSYDYSSGKSLVGYYTISTFTFNVDNLENLKQYIDTAVDSGATSIRNINYQLSNMDEVYQEVLMLAIENAKDKAERICGCEVAIKSVKEEYVYSCTSLYRTYTENITNALMGCIDIEARVSVEFE